MSHKSKKARADLKKLAGRSVKSNNSGVHITRISAKPQSSHPDTSNTRDTHSQSSQKPLSPVNESASLAKEPTAEQISGKIAEPAPDDSKNISETASKKAAKKAQKSSSEEKKPFILFRPFVKFGRYLRDSWHELRQVRWPNRKATWKMTLAVLVYCAIFIVFITLLDMLFSFLFQAALK